MKLPKKLLSLGLVITMLIVSFPKQSYALNSVDEIEVSTIYETAGLIADKQSYDTAILVNLNDSIADGLSASGLSGTLNAPLLLSENSSIPNETMKRLSKVKTVYLIGGIKSIGKSVENTLMSKGFNVKRIDGDDRIKTSYNVAKEINSKQKVNTVMLTNAYKGEPDAISIASVAARDKAAIILTDGKSIPFSTNEVKSYAIGGTSTMDDTLVKNTNSTRLGGSDRFDTNKKIINQFYNGIKEFYIAGSRNLTNALLASSLKSPVVLVDNNSNKSILKNATKITTVGDITEELLEECLNITNGIGDSNTGVIKKTRLEEAKELAKDWYNCYEVGDINNVPYDGVYLVDDNYKNGSNYYYVFSYVSAGQEHSDRLCINKNDMSDYKLLYEDLHMEKVVSFKNAEDLVRDLFMKEHGFLPNHIEAQNMEDGMYIYVRPFNTYVDMNGIEHNAGGYTPYLVNIYTGEISKYTYTE
ncbi:TPA: cell wall-binding repeat-containing protein [Clostridioides difficile]|nr:cell wall-binding repeat-containing protein [Clostridioides difficile]HBF4923003.1 cell wall-binding repeat-containing protein [Clostridioides difficile]